MRETLFPILAGPFLWLCGAIVFDGVHWLLHLMLRSDSRVLRALAWPHAVHHEWIDRDLETHWDLQIANIFCHIVPEYLTQLVFTGLVAVVLPLPYAVVLAALQTIVFLFVLYFGGRDVNHRPVPRIDAHPPGWSTPPSYHLLHHVWPDAHFSAYTKLVDRIVGGGAQIAGRRFAMRGADSELGRALAKELEMRHAEVCPGAEADYTIDVLVLLDPALPLDEPVEEFILATRDRQVPPEVWAVRDGVGDAHARYYLTDPRVSFRALISENVALAALSPSAAHSIARTVLFWVRRDAHCVALARPLDWRTPRRFLRTPAVVPALARPVRHRLEYVDRRPATG